ncbi:hypothetical protein DERP_013101 [Dermatophagoides pteronyssinus]|uniref:Uncharacterized protein n=1 Tax=Dermatophagoides pteronyssinus TaxID=6956 RepID=A0ABQ8J5L1_DERPT|nr:hypothetical protein DERP_013101 [Dermatophagoides pteronyssinus]
MVEKWIRFSNHRLQTTISFKLYWSWIKDLMILVYFSINVRISCNFLLNTCGWKNQLNDDNQ